MTAIAYRANGGYDEMFCDDGLPRQFAILRMKAVRPPVRRSDFLR